jgi:hypothetical protein
MVAFQSRLPRLERTASSVTGWTLALAASCAIVCLHGCDSSSVYLGSNLSDAGGAHPGSAGHPSKPTSIDAGAAPGGATDGGRPSTPATADGGAGCPAGFGDCDRNAANGCEADLTRDRDHCGGCNLGCKSADCACQVGQLVATCTGTRADCNMDPRDGCEVDLTSDANHCGSCDKACPTRGFDTFGASCVGGRCMLVCEPGMGDCDADPSNGCESFLYDNPNCGACGVTCNCNGGSCAK